MSERPRCEQCEKYRARILELAADYERGKNTLLGLLQFVKEERDAAIRALGIANRPLSPVVAEFMAGDPEVDSRVERWWKRLAAEAAMRERP